MKKIYSKNNKIKKIWKIESEDFKIDKDLIVIDKPENKKKEENKDKENERSQKGKNKEVHSQHMLI